MNPTTEPAVHQLPSHRVVWQTLTALTLLAVGLLAGAGIGLGIARKIDERRVEQEARELWASFFQKVAAEHLNREQVIRLLREQGCDPVGFVPDSPSSPALADRDSIAGVKKLRSKAWPFRSAYVCLCCDVFTDGTGHGGADLVFYGGVPPDFTPGPTKPKTAPALETQGARER